jgi:hypothetical protein
MSHISTLRVKKITALKAEIPRRKLGHRACENHLQLRFKAIFVKFKSNQGMIRTKTAILSIADLKAENLTVLREAFKALPGVEKIDFNLQRSVAVLEFDPSQSHIDDFLRAALKAGFKVL